MSAASLLGGIVALPLAMAMVLGALHLASPTRTRERLFALLGIAAPVVSAGLGLLALGRVVAGERLHADLFQWIALGDFRIEVAFTLDPLSAVMVFIVTFVGALIHIYATGYMHGERAYGKFFAYFNFFLGSMLLLVMADNPIILFIGWELVGLASYLLIGWYYDDPANVRAANKAFIANRVGDFGFVAALALLFAQVGMYGFDFDTLAAHVDALDPAMAALIATLLFVGAMGKSAQIPLYVWLPDAMAGPTPVSALIHAATMVTAGVYMVARFAFLYEKVPQVGLFVASVGAASALLAALFASYQRDIKKILAFSTMSQLGYMFIGVGLGAYGSGIFHLFTHAFFKALLFLGAGAVIVALHHEQNIFRMGGLRRSMGLVSATMLAATLAIAGVPPFAGFFSKDAILLHAFASHHYLLWGVGVATAYLTAYYMFRLYFIVFVAPARTPQTPRPVPSSMRWPLVVLAVGSVAAGWFGMPDAFVDFLHLPQRGGHPAHATALALDTLNVLVAAAGIYVAYRLHGRGVATEPPATAWRTLMRRTLFVDDLYDRLFVRPLRGASLLFARIVDEKIVDGLIGAGVGGYRLAANAFAMLQNGRLQWYLFVMLAGVGAMATALLLGAGG